jgi:hypothetical protein
MYECIGEYSNMMYYTTSDSSYTGTYSNYYNDYIYRNSTTASSSDYRNLDYFSQTSTTSPTIPIPYGQTYVGTGYNIRCLERQEVAYKPSEQELLRQREEKIKAEEAAKKEKVEAEEAARKARLLLTEYLDHENMKRLLNKEPLEVPSRLFGDIKYQIPISNDRIKARKENKVITELCLAVKGSGQLPMDDVILTKLLHILHDEENMLKTANHFNTKENLLARLN